MSYLGWVFAILFVLLAPNLFWLGTSTLKIQNVSNFGVDSIAYLAHPGI